MTNKCLTDILETVIHRCPGLHENLLSLTYSISEVDYLARKILKLLVPQSDANYITYPYKEYVIQIYPMNLTLPFRYDIYVYRKRNSHEQ